MLGGGHGWLQGQYGPLADNIISVQLVLANGSLMEVSETHQSDLFWALRGAGHNFGIVTSVEYRVFDAIPEESQWVYEEYVFDQDKLEPLFEQANTFLRTTNQSQPVELTHFGCFEFTDGIVRYIPTSQCSQTQLAHQACHSLFGNLARHYNSCKIHRLSACTRAKEQRSSQYG